MHFFSAAVRSLATAGVANVALKPLARRRRPPGAGPGPFRPLTSSMPSGHAASDTAFAVGPGSSGRRHPRRPLVGAAVALLSRRLLGAGAGRTDNGLSVQSGGGR